MRKILASTLLFLLTFPSVTLAASDWGVIAEDTIAGFGTEIEVRGPKETKFNVYVSPPQNHDIKLTALTDAKGRAVLELDAEDTQTAGVYTVSLVDRDGAEQGQDAFEVFPGPPATLELDPEQEEIEEGQNVLIHVGIFDEFDNPIAERPLLLVSGDGDVEKIDSETGKDGFADFSFTPDHAGDADLTVVDLLSEAEKKFTLNILPSSASSTADRNNPLRASLLDTYQASDNGAPTDRQYGFIDHFDITVENPEPVLRVNESCDMTITARDRNDRKVEDYVGNVTIETTDTLAQLPQGTVKFHASDRGEITLPLALMFGTPGEHKLFVKDSEDEDIRGMIESIWVVGPNVTPQTGRIEVESHHGTQTIPTRNVTISGKAPAYINLELYENDSLLALGSSDQNGRFSFSVTLDATQTRHEMIIREGEGGFDRVSDPFILIVDNLSPETGDVSLAPDTVAPGEPFTVLITAESHESVLVALDTSAPVAMAEGGPNAEGMSEYQTSLVAPDTEGTHQVTVTVRDQAGNEVQKAKTLTVESGGLPIVSDVHVQAEQENVLLSWSAVPGAAQYRIYFGASPNDLADTIDTNSSATSARITGLEKGRTYYFALTAVDSSGKESRETSVAVSITTAGSLFAVQTMGLVNGASMQWIAPVGTSITEYHIHYGVQSGQYTEERVMPGSQTSVEFTDLINGVTYYMLLSGVQENGEVLTDTVEVTVVPGQAGQPGMHLAPPSPLPSSVGGPSQPTHSAPSRVPGTGLPSSILFIAILLGAGVAYYSKRKEGIPDALLRAMDRCL